MKPRKKNPSTPDSLAADGNRGAVVSTRSTHSAKCNPDPTVVLLLASAAVEAAIVYLERYSRQTDAPPVGLVEAADHLDAAVQSLERARSS